MGLNKIHIIRDTKEKKPLLFNQYDVTVGSDALKAGDYTMSGFDMPGDDNSVIVERKKDCMELCGNLGVGWEAFCNEAELLTRYNHRCIVVCGPYNFPYLYEKKYTKMSPSFIMKRLAILQLKYGLFTIFLQDRDTAEEYIFRLFNEVVDKTSNET